MDQMNDDRNVREDSGGAGEGEEQLWSEAGQSGAAWTGERSTPPQLSFPMPGPAAARPAQDSGEEAPEPEQPKPSAMPECPPPPEPEYRSAPEETALPEYQPAPPPERGNVGASGPDRFPEGSEWEEKRPGEGRNDMATASLVLGILSLIGACCAWAGIVCGALGIMFALLSRADEPMSGRARIGLATSVAGLVLGMVVILVLLFTGAGMMVWR